MYHRVRYAVTSVVVLFACSISLGQTNPSDVSATTQPAEEFLRFVPDGPEGGTLQAATATYRNRAGQTVDLIAAVHVADPAFYRALNEQFKHEDALLYELIMPKDMAISDLHDPDRPNSWITIFQHFLTDTLKLQFQLDGINYDAKNFVHADLDAETFTSMQAQRGESFVTLMLQSMLQQLANADDDNDPTGGVGPLLMALTNPDKAMGLKLMLARQFSKMDDMLAGMEGPDGSVLITERNKAAIAVLKQQLAAGKKHVGIFYGAGHLRGMEKILVDEMGFKKVDEQWRVAWDMTPHVRATPATSPSPQ
ncbi:MAG: hypothetical protein JO353_02095 [Phycisphaerae bacterium]|nr:hypothetical protein [Phycisphaerae bacterium]